MSNHDEKSQYPQQVFVSFRFPVIGTADCKAYDFFTNNYPEVTFTVHSTLGHYISTVFGVNNDNGNKAWIIYVNDKAASSGVDTLTVSPGDMITLRLETQNYYFTVSQSGTALEYFQANYPSMLTYSMHDGGQYIQSVYGQANNTAWQMTWVVFVNGKSSNQDVSALQLSSQDVISIWWKYTPPSTSSTSSSAVAISSVASTTSSKTKHADKSAKL